MEDSVFVKVLPYITSIKNELLNLKEQHPDFQPVVTVIQLTSGAESAGSDSFTTSLVKSLLTQCGITINCIQVLPESETSSVINIVQKLNCDQNVHGIIVQLPHDYDDSSAILDAITPSKDVAGVCQKNIENFDLNEDESFLSCAASAVVELIQNAGLLLENANVFVLGKERIIFPISKMLLSKNAVVSVCRTADENIPIGVKDSDVIIITSKPTNDLWRHLKPGAIIVECGAVSEGGDIQHNTDLNKNKFHYISSSCFWNMFAVMIAKNMLLTTKMLFESKWNLKIIPLKFGPPGLSDIEIARSQNLKDIGILAKEIGLLPYEIELYGDRKAKISLSVLDRFKFRSPGKYVVVSGINPTSFGEGKSTTSVGLCQALAVQMKRNAMVCLRQPSQGPTFGIKGGAAGGGYSQVVPMEEFNLHLTGDIHAVTAANNLLAAQLDARIFHEATQSDESLFQRLVKTVKGKKVFTKIQLARLQRLGIHKTDPTSLDKDEISRFVRLDIDPSTITWHRVIDTNDRFLRKIAIGLSQTEKKMVRETQFDISVASEIMAILALTTDMADMKEKLSKMVVANDKKGNPVTADDLGATGALAILLKDAIRPNLMQTLEGAPVFVHAGPFANIAHGNSSVIADKIALKIVGENGYVVTEAGFGSDIGLEKFCNIKCRYSGLIPNAVVIVATIRAIKLHGGGPNIGASSSLPKEYTEENIALVEKGFCNLAKHIQIANKFGLPVIVALNRFNTDTEAELNLLKELSEKNGAFRCVICSHFSEGSKGAKQLAEAVITACNQASKFNLLYDLKTPLEHKIRVIAEQIYGAEGVQFKSEAKQMLELFEKQGFGDLAICMAKTPFSLSDDATKKGVPENFTVTVQDVKLSAGAGYVYPLLGSVLTMPALSTRPCIYDMDIDSDNGNIEGLF